MTMIELRLNAFTVARVHDGDVAIPGYAAAGILSGSAAASGTGSTARTLIMEVAARSGHPSSYGLLGVAFEPGGDQLRLSVPWSGADGSPWAQSLAGRVDDVRLGLPRKYAAVVLEVLTAESTGRFPPGSIRVVRAAHGLVGSSEVFFRWLTRAMVHLLTLDDLDLGGEAGEEKIRSAWRRKDGSRSG